MQVTNIEYHFEGIPPFKIPRSLINEQIIRLIENEGKELGEIAIILCSDQYLLKMNRQYLEHDFFTDIITFNYNENQIVNGDLFISTDRVKENSAQYGISTSEELCRVIFHGLLHLTGYDDKTEKEKQLMREKENYYLSFTDFKQQRHGFEI